MNKLLKLSCFIILSFVLNFASIKNLQENIVAYYPFNGNALDASGNGNHANIYGAQLSDDRFGNPNAAMQFDGINDYLVIPHNEKLNFNSLLDDYSISLWIKNDIKINARIIEKWDGNNSSVYPFQINMSDTSFQVAISSVLNKYSKEIYPVDKTIWNHFVFTYSKSNNEMKIYINGILKYRKEIFAEFSTANNFDIYIGKAYVNLKHFEGKLDEITFFNKALSDNEIYKVYKSENVLIADTIEKSDSLIAYYPFNGNANDESVNSNDGTVYGATLTEDRFGKENSAYYFDGLDDIVFFEGFKNVYLNGKVESYTISFWVNSTNPTDSYIFEKWDGKPSYPFTFRASNSNCFTGIYDGTNNPSLFYENMWNGQWRFLTLVTDHLKQKLLFYVDGQPIDSVSYAHLSNFGNDSRAYIGGTPESNERFFNGKIDDIRIYNEALNVSEIQKLYAEENSNNLVLNPSFELNTNGTVNNWTVDFDGTGTVNYIQDFGKSGNASVFVTAVEPNSWSSSWLSDFIDVTPNTAYVLSANIYQKRSIDQQLYMFGFREYDEDGKYISSTHGNSGQETGNWFTKTRNDLIYSEKTKKVKIELRVLNNSSFISDSIFFDDISFSKVDPEVMLNLTYPENGEQFTPGEEINIKWESSNVELLNLFYTTVGGGGYDDWHLIARGIDASDGEYNWKIPYDDSDQYRILLVDSLKHYQIFGDSLFSVRNSVKNGSFNKGTLNMPDNWTIDNNNQAVAGWANDFGKDDMYSVYVSNIPKDFHTHSFVSDFIEVQQNVCYEYELSVFASSQLPANVNATIFVTYFDKNKNIVSGTSGRYLNTSPGVWIINKNSSVFFSNDEIAYVKIGLGCSNNSSDTFNGKIYFDCLKFNKTNPEVKLQLLSPIESKTFKRGENVRISWESSNIDQIDISCSNRNSKSTIIKQNINASQKTFNWKIPEGFNGDYSISINSSSYNIADQSINYITIVDVDSIAVLSPNGGEDLSIGSDYTIKWYANFQDNVNISLYKEDQEYITLANRIYSTGVYNFKIPDTLQVNDKYKIRVNRSSNPSSYDESDDYFSIGVNTSNLIPNSKFQIGDGEYPENWNPINNSSENISWNKNFGNGDNYSISIKNVTTPNKETGWETDIFPFEANTLLTLSFDVYSDLALNNDSYLFYSFQYYDENKNALSGTGGEQKFSTKVWETKSISHFCEVDEAKYASLKIFLITSSSISTEVFIDNVSLKTATPLKKLKLTSFNQGETISGGSQQKITWESANIDKVTIRFNYNNKGDILVENLDASLGTFNWTVPNIESELSSINIQDESNSYVFDASKSFKISLTAFPQINLNKSSIDFGDVKISKRIVDSLLIKNLGKANLTIQGVGLDNYGSSEAIFNVESWKTVIAPGDSTFMIVSFKPTEIKDYNTYLRITSNATTEDLKIPMSGRGIKNTFPVITADKDYVRFNNRYINQEHFEEFTVSNDGDESLIISNISVNNSSFEITESAFSLEPNSSKTIQVKFIPTEIKSYSGEIIITHNAEGGIKRIFLSGSGINKPIPEINISSNNLNFGSVIIGDSLQINLQISNEGNGELIVSNINSDNSSFRINKTNLSVAPSSSSLVVVTYVASNVGSEIGNLILDHNAEGQSISISMSGTGIAFDKNINVSHNLTFSDVNNTTSYRLLSIPGNVNINLSEIFTGNYKTEWRAFRDPGSGDFIEYDGQNNFKFLPGKGYWVLSKRQFNVNQELNQVDLNKSEGYYYYSIQLQNGWNIISSPFNKEINWSNIKTLNNISESIYKYNGTYYESPVMRPFEAYYFYNADNLSQLKIPYYVPESLGKHKSSIQQKYIELKLINGKYEDIVQLGTSENSNSDYDINDKFAPPTRFNETSISSFEEEITQEYKYLRKNYKPAVNGGITFNLEIKKNPNNPSSLVISNHEKFSNSEICLYDIRMGKMYDIKENNLIKLNQIHNEDRFVLLIGDRTYIDSEAELLNLKNNFDLTNYPNPFNPTTVIRYEVKEKTNISVKVFNSIGEEVAVLINNQQKEAGRYEVKFDASGLPSGVYFYYIITDKDRFSNKMLLLK